MQPHHLQMVDSCRTCTLRARDFFCDLSPHVIAAFDAIKITIPYRPGALVFTEGEDSRGVYVLCQGRVKLTLGSGDRTLVVGLCNPGQILGLPSCMSGQPYQFTAEVMEPCQLNFARREDFLRLLRKYPEAAIRAAKHVSDNLHDVMDLIHTVGLAQSATERMARFFLLLADGVDLVDHETRLELGFTHRELAQTIGATRETACRVLGHFKKKHVVTMRGSTVVIQDKAALRELARVP
jgi:CRP/FNR family transcriptional regulator